jgi:hypothetical protein
MRTSAAFSHASDCWVWGQRFRRSVIAACLGLVLGSMALTVRAAEAAPLLTSRASIPLPPVDTSTGAAVRMSWSDYMMPAMRAGRPDTPSGPTTASTRQLHFTFDSPGHPWTSTELAQLQTWTASQSPVMDAVRSVAGPPAHDLTINVSHDPDLTVAGTLSPGNPAQLALHDLELAVFVHELNHAVHNEWILGNSIWEEGMARAAEDEELHLLAAQGVSDPNGDPEHAYTYDVYYDALNVPDVGVQDGSIRGYGDPALTFLRYEQAGYAFGKLLIKKAAFLSKFNAKLFKQSSGVLPDSTLIRMAASVEPAIEGLPFDSWYQRQHIFDSTPPSGCRLFQRISTYPVVDFFCRDAAGLETPQAGASVTCSVYAVDDQLLYTQQSPTTDLGWIMCDPGTALAGYSGRIKLVATGTSATGSATSTYYRQGGAETGVFGVVTNADNGTVTFSSPANAFPTFSVPVTQGAFAAPTLSSFRGTFRVRFEAAGLSAGRTITKAASPYALILTGTRTHKRP